jgi:hypothetical protein
MYVTDVSLLTKIKYSRVPNKQAGCLIDNEKKISFLYLFSYNKPKNPTYISFVSLLKRLFGTIHLFGSLEY